MALRESQSREANAQVNGRIRRMAVVELERLCAAFEHAADSGVVRLSLKYRKGKLRTTVQLNGRQITVET